VTPRTGSENTELILADGQRVEIDSKQAKIEYAANSASVSVNDTAFVKQTEKKSRNAFNQVSIPYGKRSYIHLSDGTQVWLNSGSRLVYPPVFRGNKREVYLEGEACFEVAENKEKPFYVSTESFKVRVLGTRFVIQADAGTKENYAVLIEGKVSLSTNSRLFAGTHELLPNQKATLSENKDGFKITAVDNIGNYFAWIDGYINFEREDLVSLAKRISRYYNIRIEVKTSNRFSTFSGKLDLKDDPERILNGLAIIFKTKYEKKGNKFVFYD
jgi:ferric-dicitrate binding protein FerR (iron transport regulator)